MPATGEGVLAHRRRRGSYNRPPMCSRALAFLLAFVLLWSTPAAQEHAFASAASTTGPASASIERAKQLQAGPVGHQATDNLPAPAHAHIEAALDAQEISTAAAAPMLPGAATAWPHAGPAPAPLAPYLDGPQRPPRRGRLVA